MEGSDSFERRGVGVPWSAVIGMHAAPRLEMGDHLFDDVSHLVDRGVELFLPVKEFTSPWFAIRSRGVSPYVAPIAERVLLAEQLAESSIVYGFGVVGLAGQRVRDMQEIPSKITDELVGMAGSLVLPRVQL